jgi:uncharacterized protein YecE (DUF72 family)
MPARSRWAEYTGSASASSPTNKTIGGSAENDVAGVGFIGCLWCHSMRGLSAVVSGHIGQTRRGSTTRDTMSRPPVRCYWERRNRSLRASPNCIDRPQLTMWLAGPVPPLAYMPRRIFVGTAGWSIPRTSTGRCPSEGTHLQRYSRIFRCAEINSSFYRPHNAVTYAKWADSTPPGFRFSVKVPRRITHEQQLRRVRDAVERFLDETDGLGRKRGPLLVQLPPSLSFDARVAGRFFELLREAYGGPVVCEPRHETWFSSRAENLLVRFKVARVAADPPPSTGADAPRGWPGIVYYRLHGAPRKYWSTYPSASLAALGDALRSIPPAVDAWCVFDNTASGAALENAWELNEDLGRP